MAPICQMLDVAVSDSEISRDRQRRTPDILSAERLSFRYGQDESAPFILKDVSFSVRDGEFVSILGPSGCGKSTLLYLLGGFLRRTSGDLRFRDMAIAGPSTARGIVFQDFALFDWQTTLSNVEFGLKCKGMHRDERRATAMRHLSLVGLQDAAGRYPRQLSGGMKQRVAIARALAAEPDVLLMDEPFGALDALSRDNLQDQFRRIWFETKKTIVFVTHSVEEAVFLSQRVIILKPNPGQIAEILAIDTAPEATRRDLEADPILREKSRYLGHLVRSVDDRASPS